jgi:Endodeoxyribonuclease RusA.
VSRLIIPGVPPSVNHMYRNARVGRRSVRVLSREAEQWANDIIVLASSWRARNKWQTAKRKTIVRLWYFWPDLRQRDTHNTLKLMLDCFEDALIYSNDKYALPQVMDYDVDRENPRVEVEFEVMGA